MVIVDACRREKVTTWCEIVWLLGSHECYYMMCKSSSTQNAYLPSVEKVPGNVIFIAIPVKISTNNGKISNRE